MKYRALWATVSFFSFDIVGSWRIDFVSPISIALSAQPLSKNEVQTYFKHRILDMSIAEMDS
jgi:hypothetical protein